MTIPRLHAAARSYATAGFPVFPCRPRDKQPTVNNWFSEATTDIATVDRWWSANPDYNIGFPPARVECSVIDLDVKDPKDNGVETWKALNEHKPETLTFLTASGGLHYHYRGLIGNSVRKVGPGIDTRGVGGYVLLPPSVTKDGEYRLLYDRPVAPLPQWIADCFAKAPPRHAPEGFEEDSLWALEYAAREVRAKIAKGDVPRIGNRDHACYAMAARLRALGLSQERCFEFCLEWAKHGDMPDEDHPLEAIVDSAYRTLHDGQNEPGSELPPPREPYQPTPTATGLRIVSAAGIVPKPIDWLWPGWAARGKLHVLGGQKGAGKSSAMFNLFATITRGGLFPDGARAPLGSVLIWSSEDDFDDVIVPRFLTAGGDITKLHYIPPFLDEAGNRRAFEPSTDMGILAARAAELPDLAAIGIDSIAAMSGKGSDSHKNAEMRRALQPAVDLAAEHRICLLGITHFTKGTQGNDPLERITGSLALTAVARIVWGLVKSEDEQSRRLVRIASNIGPSGGGFDFTVEQRPVPGIAGLTAQAVCWAGFKGGSARELIEEVAGEMRQSKVIAATEFLDQQLRAAGANGMNVLDLKRAAAANSVSWRTVERAKEGMQITARQRAGAAHAGWYWTLTEFVQPARFDVTAY